MREAVIVSTARTGIGRAFRGAFNNTKSPTLIGHAIRHAVDRAHVAGEEVDDVVIGTVLSAGTAGMNVARHGSFAAGLPTSVSAQTVDRQCSSGLMAVAIAAKQIIVDSMQVVVGGGQENISAVQNHYFEWAYSAMDTNVYRSRSTSLHADAADSRVRCKQVRNFARATRSVRFPVAEAGSRGAAKRSLQRRNRSDDRLNGHREQGHKGSR